MIKVVVKILLVVSLVHSSVANPLLDFLNRRDYDQDAILRQFPSQAPPVEKKEDEKAANEEEEAPGFIPLQVRPPQNEVGSLALILPIEGSGLVGQVADDFYRGCTHGIRLSGRKIIVDLYPTDGQSAPTVQGYVAAVEKGANVIIGPMLKSNVAALLRRYPQTPAPTVLLQPAIGKGYFVMTLDAAKEAADLARLLAEQDQRDMLVVEQSTARGAAQREQFENVWLELKGVLSGRFLVKNETDWQRLFDMLKEEEREPGRIFVAGDANFAAKARNFVPQQHSVFAISTINTGAQSASALLVENLGFMEMPWFVGLDELRAIFDAPKERTLPVVRQRFFVLGTDVCRAALSFPQWSEGWTMQGLGGDWIFAEGGFGRKGSLVSYRAGQLQKIQ
ncbi:MAG: hypothetical protein ACNYPH_03620 [Gammaproteobacteria bacterium WSBS_2016_MAG_OTU1]